MIEVDFLTGLGLDADTAEALLALIGEEAEGARQQSEQKLAEAPAQQQTLPRVVAATPGGGCTAVEQEQYAKMGYLRRLKLKQQNPVLYEQLRGEENG